MPPPLGLAQETFPYHLRVTSRGRSVSITFNANGAVQHFNLSRDKSHPSRRNPVPRKRTVFAPRDLEIAED